MNVSWQCAFVADEFHVFLRKTNVDHLKKEQHIEILLKNSVFVKKVIVQLVNFV